MQGGERVSTIHDEYQYRIDTPLGPVMVPFRVAIAATVYPSRCIYHHDDPADAEPKSHLCSNCKAFLTKYFREISEEWPNLQDALARNGRAASSERVGGTNDPSIGPLPINTDVSDALALARSAVWSTVGQLVQDRLDVRLPADHGTDILADWIVRRHIDYLASHPRVEFLDSVFTDVAKAAEAVRDQAFECRPVEVEMKHSNCHQFTEDDTGSRVACPGQLVGVILRNGNKVVECSVDPLHRIPADAWFQIQNRRAGYRKRDLARLQKKYVGKKGATA